MNLEAEIAGRLGASPSEVLPVLEMVIERVRQQVAHYGYARLAGLGTFRGHNGDMTFEPDPALAESANLRFAGLKDVQMPLPGAPEARAEEDLPVSGPADEEPWMDDFAEESDEPLNEEPFGTEGFTEEPDEDEPPAEGSVPEEGFEQEPYLETPYTEEPFAEEPLENVPSGETKGFQNADEVAENRWMEGTDDEKESTDYLADEFALPEEGVVDLQWREEADYTVPPEYDEEEREEGGYEEIDGPVFPPSEEDDANVEEEPAEDDEPSVLWHEGEDDVEDHPLGPMPPASFEEADYSFIDEHTGEPSVEWSSLAGDVPKERASAPKASERTARPAERIRRQPPPRQGARGAAPGGRGGVWIGAAVVLIIAAAAVAYFVLRPEAPPSSQLIDQGRDEVLTDSAVASPDTTSTVPDKTAVVPEEEETEEPATTVDQPESTPLRSAEAIDRANGGFTIVVASETSSGSAETIAGRYRSQGFRTGILEARQDGTTRYRVGIGQFRTSGEATRTRDGMAGKEIPEDAWVFRIR